MNLKKAALAISSGIAVIALAVPALAQDDTTEPSETEESTTTDKSALRADRKAGQEAAFAEALAAELGLPADDVAAAVNTVREAMMAERKAEMAARMDERLTSAVESGKLSQSEADEIRAKIAAGDFEGLRDRAGKRGPRGHGPRQGGHHAPPSADTSAA